MPAKGMRQAQQAIGRLVSKISGPMAERTLTEVLIIAQGYATLWTPADTGNLRNSQYRVIDRYAGGLRGRVGYTAAYALYVHQASGKLKGQPRAHFGKTRDGVEFGGGTGVGNYWDPDGKPQFLRLAFEDPVPRADIEAAIKRGMKL